MPSEKPLCERKKIHATSTHNKILTRPNSIAFLDEACFLMPTGLNILQSFKLKHQYEFSNEGIKELNLGLCTGKSSQKKVILFYRFFINERNDTNTDPTKLNYEDVSFINRDKFIFFKLENDGMNSIRHGLAAINTYLVKPLINLNKKKSDNILENILESGNEETINEMLFIINENNNTTNFTKEMLLDMKKKNNYELLEDILKLPNVSSEITDLVNSDSLPSRKERTPTDQHLIKNDEKLYTSDDNHNVELYNSKIRVGNEVFIPDRLKHELFINIK